MKTSIVKNVSTIKHQINVLRNTRFKRSLHETQSFTNVSPGSLYPPLPFLVDVLVVYYLYSQ